jgi:hypothetical protein
MKFTAEVEVPVDCLVATCIIFSPDSCMVDIGGYTHPRPNVNSNCEMHAGIQASPSLLAKLTLRVLGY